MGWVGGLAGLLGLGAASASASVSASGGGQACRAYAEGLNARWRAGAEAFPGATGGGEGLEAWLAEHGVLLSMCIPTGFPPTCGHDKPGGLGQDRGMDHVSASWVGADQDGEVPALFSQVFPTIPYGVGRVFSPEKVSVECLYPTDAATDARDGSGCGPQSQDAYFGSAGYALSTPEEREGTKQFLEQRLADFGKTPAEWADVGCLDFVGGEASPIGSIYNASTWTPADQSTMDACKAVVQAGGAAAADQKSTPTQELINAIGQNLAPFLGHPPCRLDDDGSCAGGTHCGGYWEWYGACSWPPSDFEEARQAQAALTKRGTDPSGKGILVWNEFVLSSTDPYRNASAPESVEAAFWVMYPGLTGPIYAYLREAARLAAENAGPGAGGVPLLRVTPTPEAAASGRLFQCDEDSTAFFSEPVQGLEEAQAWLERAPKRSSSAASTH